MDSSTSCSGLCALTHNDHNSELPDHGIRLQNATASSFISSDERISTKSTARTISYPWNNFICPLARSGIAHAVTVGGRLSHPLFPAGIYTKTISSTYTFVVQKWAWETCVDVMEGPVSASPSAYRTNYTFKNLKWAWETSVDAFYESSVDKVKRLQTKRKGTSESLRDLCIKVLNDEKPIVTSSRSCPQVSCTPKVTSAQLSCTASSTTSADVPCTSSTVSVVSERLQTKRKGTSESLRDLGIKVLNDEKPTATSSCSCPQLSCTPKETSAQPSLTASSTTSADVPRTSSTISVVSEADSNLSVSTRSGSLISLTTVTSAKSLRDLCIKVLSDDQPTATSSSSYPQVSCTKETSSQLSYTASSTTSANVLCTSSAISVVSEADSDLSVSTRSGSLISLTTVTSAESLRDLCIKVMSDDQSTAISLSSCPQVSCTPKETSAQLSHTASTTLSTTIADVPLTSSTISVVSEADSDLSVSTRSTSLISLTTVRSLESLSTMSSSISPSSSSSFSSEAESDLSLLQSSSESSVTRTEESLSQCSSWQPLEESMSDVSLGSGVYLSALSDTAMSHDSRSESTVFLSALSSQLEIEEDSRISLHEVRMLAEESTKELSQRPSFFRRRRNNMSSTLKSLKNKAIKLVEVLLGANHSRRSGYQLVMSKNKESQ